jgi:hypothetical protein
MFGLVVSDPVGATAWLQVVAALGADGFIFEVLAQSAVDRIDSNHAVGSGNKWTRLVRRARALRDQPLLAWTLGESGRVFGMAGSSALAAQILQEALVIARREEMTELEALVLGNLAAVFAERGPSSAFVVVAQDANTASRRQGDLRGELLSTVMLGLAFVEEGALREAHATLAQAISLLGRHPGVLLGASDPTLDSAMGYPSALILGLSACLAAREGRRSEGEVMLRLAEHRLRELRMDAAAEALTARWSAA